MRIFKKFSALCAYLVILFGGAAAANDVVSHGRIILQIKGAIAAVSQSSVLSYDLAQIEALGMRDVVTETPWTDGPVRFTGVLVRDILESAGATGSTINAIALNDYSVEIPIVDFSAHDVILALKRDGEYLTVRNRGPLWIIYPWSEEAMLQNELYYSRSIWQLNTIEVK